MLVKCHQSSLWRPAHYGPLGCHSTMTVTLWGHGVISSRTPRRANAPLTLTSPVAQLV